MVSYPYQVPLEELKFNIFHFLGVEDLLGLPAYKDFTPDLLNVVLEEAAKFANEVLAPLNRVGDKQPARIKNHEVTMPEGFKTAYQAFAQNGWNALPFDPIYGGQGLPWIVNVAVEEMISGANMAFGLCPLLTQGVIDLLSHHASDAQQKAYLPSLVSGQWTGTMCLTEPQAGSDLGAITTKAVKKQDHYLITGQKIFITYGEHDLAENIIHMVLARVEGAPAGSKGISLFIVPKLLSDGTRNDVQAISLEHKLGIHASPTCVMSFGDKQECVGYLVGREQEGLKYMFTMMNNARLAVGVEGIGVAEHALQQAYHYALERTQMGKSIIKHPDVGRMLITMSCQIEAMRSLALFVAKSIDLAKHHSKPETRAAYEDLVAFLIPVLKAHSTNLGFEHCSNAMQIFAGVGYTEEMPIAQSLRDIRITMIYEGTNGIQALDLVGRKLNLRLGQLVENVKTLMQEWLLIESEYQALVLDAWANFIVVTAAMQKLGGVDPYKAQFLAHDYLKFCGILFGAIMLLKQDAVLESAQDLSEDYKNSKKENIVFYMEYILPQTEYLTSILLKD